MIQGEDESAIDFMRRVVHWMNHEEESILSALPTPQSIFDFAALWHTYGTEFLQGIIECIEEGDDPAPLRKFIRKYKLSWKIPKSAVTD